MEKNNFGIKAFCSCIRNSHFVKMLLDMQELEFVSVHPQAGDVLVLKILNCDVGYGKLEIETGENYSYKNGDFVVGVLGNRYSGTNVYGELSGKPLQKGDKLYQLSIGGIFSESAYVENSHRGESATYSEVVGFVLNKDTKRILNIRDINNLNYKSDKITIEKNYFIFGTSAEVGKTTFVANLCKYLKSLNKKVACAKVCGTGRLKDKFNYKNAGADFVVDYVDIGYSSTYKLDSKKIDNMIEKLFNLCNEQGEYNLYEVGGDMLEGGADRILEFATKNKAYIFVIVNDAMGAMTAQRLLRDYKKVLFVAWKPNIKALKERIGSKVYNIYSYENFEQFGELLYDI